MTIDEWLKQSATRLAEASISSAKLDAEILLAHTLNSPRTYLHAHGDEKIDPRRLEIAEVRLALRLDRTPIAYIIGHKEFYGRRFNVTPATLIPRPESEAMITLLKKVARQTELPLSTEAPKLVDVGSGSGCLGITAKLELPNLDVTLLDTSRHALTVAETNAKRLGAQVVTLKSNLLQSYPFHAQYILANLPYVSRNWEVSPETQFEPDEALYANDDGLALIHRLIEKTPSHIAPGGSLFIEADPRQHQAVIKKAAKNGLTLQATEGFILHFQPA